MANIFRMLGDALTRGANALGEGVAAERMGPDWRKKAEMLAQVNQIDLKIKQQQPEIQRMTAESMAYNRDMMAESAKEQARLRRIGNLATLYEADPNAVPPPDASPEDIAAAIATAKISKDKRDLERQKQIATFTAPATLGGRTFEPGKEYDRDEVSTFLEMQREQGRNERDVTGTGGSEPMMWVDELDENGQPILDEQGQPIQTLVPRSQAAGRTRRKPRPVGLINKDIAFKSAQPVLDTISNLSKEIVIGEGPMATGKGMIRAGLATVNLDDKMNRYRAAVRGFAPLLARALGHTGVLTEQDVERTETLFGKPSEGDTLRASKIAMVKQLLEAVNNAGKAGLLPPEDDKIGFEARLNAVLPTLELGQAAPAAGGSDIDQIEALLRKGQ